MADFYYFTLFNGNAALVNWGFTETYYLITILGGGGYFKLFLSLFQRLNPCWALKPLLNLTESRNLEKYRERGQWSVYYTSPQSFRIAFSYSLDQQLWELLIG